MSHIRLYLFITSIIFHGYSIVSAQQAVVTNDMCSTAFNVSLPFSASGVNTTKATSDGEICGVIKESDIGVWYLYKSVSDRVVEVVLKGSAPFVAQLAVFAGPCNNLKCLDNVTLSWVAYAGIEYRLFVAGSAASTGVFAIDIKEIERPINDNCEAANKLIRPTIGSTSGATHDFGELTCGISEVVRGVWYEYEPSEDRIAIVEITQSSFNYVKVALFSGDTCPELACEQFDFVSGMKSYFQAVHGKKYFILVTGGFTFKDAGTFSISITEVDIPPNDACQNATTIDFRSTGFFGNTVGALTERNLNEGRPCNYNPISRGVWYKYTPPTNMNITLQTTSGDFYHQIVVFKGESCNPAPSCQGSITSGSSRLSASIPFRAEEAVQYFFLVTGNNRFEYAGTFTLSMFTDSVIPVPPPSNIAPKTPTVTPSLRPINLPTIGPARPVTSVPTRRPTLSPSKAPTLSPVRSPPTEAPTSRPVTITLPTNSPEATTSLPTKSPTSPAPSRRPNLSPSATPTLSPVQMTGQPTRSPSTKSPEKITSVPTKSPAAPPPTRRPTFSPSSTPKLSPVQMTRPPALSPGASPDPPDNLPTDVPETARPSALPIVNPVPTNRPTDLPTTTPTKFIVEATNPPFRPMMLSYDDDGKGKGRKHKNDDSSKSHKGKGKMRYMGKGGMHSGKSMDKMNHDGKGMGKMKHHYHYSGNGKGGSDNDTASASTSTSTSTTGGRTIGKYYRKNCWDIINSWIERRRSHHLWRSMAS